MSSTINEADDYTLSSPTARIKPTARAFDVAPRTLSRRLNGGLTRQEGHSSQQILSSSQEKMLVSWILEQERLRHASIHQQIREFTPQLRLQVNSSPNLEGHARRFRRHPSLNAKTQPWFVARSTHFKVPRIMPLQRQQSLRKSPRFPLCFPLIMAPPTYIMRVPPGLLLNSIIRARPFDAGAITIRSLLREFSFFRASSLFYISLR
jgi:hypothetical protein